MATEEIWREGSRVVVDYDNDRIHITSVGDFDVAHALRCKEFIFGIFDKSERYFDLVIDISREGTHARGTRRIWKQINAHPKVRYVALCGVNSIAKIIHTIIIGFKKHPKFRLFTNGEEAQTWISDLVAKFRRWFDAEKNELPANSEEVVISIDGENYVSRFDALRRQFRVEDELKETFFNIDEHHILWRHRDAERTGKLETYEL